MRDGSARDEIEYWNRIAGPRWSACQEWIDPQIRPLGQAAMEATGIATGERVLDVGCGCGDSSLELARRVGARGAVVAVDVSQPMLERARARAGALPNLELRLADAQTADLGRGRFDVVFSRFGVMFFPEPETAFRNLLGALRPGGRLGFVCWQAFERCPYMSEPLAAAASLVELPPRTPPGAPGPFSLADPGRLSRILGAAGFTDVKLGEWNGELVVGGVERALRFFLEIGPLSGALRQAQAGPELRARVEARLRATLARYEDEGAVRMPGAAWLVTARRP